MAFVFEKKRDFSYRSPNASDTLGPGAYDPQIADRRKSDHHRLEHIKLNGKEIPPFNSNEQRMKDFKKSPGPG